MSKTEKVKGYEVKGHPSHSKRGRPEFVRRHWVGKFSRPKSDRPLDVTYWQDRGFSHNAAVNIANANLHREAAKIRARNK